jgi:hypothetical protein
VPRDTTSFPSFFLSLIGAIIIVPRVYVNFQRKGVVVERGAAAIEITRDATVEEVYKMALNQEFKEFLISDRQYDDESMTWEFEIMKEDNSDGFSPYPPHQ